MNFENNHIKRNNMRYVGMGEIESYDNDKEKDGKIGRPNSSRNCKGRKNLKWVPNIFNIASRHLLI